MEDVNQVRAEHPGWSDMAAINKLLDHPYWRGKKEGTLRNMLFEAIQDRAEAEKARELNEAVAKLPEKLKAPRAMHKK